MTSPKLEAGGKYVNSRISHSPDISKGPHLLGSVKVLEGMVSRIFHQTPRVVHLNFEGGSIYVLFESPTDPSITVLKFNGRSSIFGRLLSEYGELQASMIHHTEDRITEGSPSLHSIIETLAEATPKIQAALASPPEGSTIIYKPTSVSGAGR